MKTLLWIPASFLCFIRYVLGLPTVAMIILCYLVDSEAVYLLRKMGKIESTNNDVKLNMLVSIAGILRAKCDIYGPDEEAKSE